MLLFGIFDNFYATSWNKTNIFILYKIKPDMLDFIKVKNFGCFDVEHTIKFNKLNVIVGPNNSGKSMIFKALNLFRICSKTSRNNNDIIWMSDYYSLIDFASAVYDSSKECMMSVSSNNDIEVLHITANSNEWENNTGSRYPIYSSKQKLDNILYIGPSRKLVDYTNSASAHYETPSGNDLFTISIQQIFPDGRNLIQFLVEKGTRQNPGMPLFEEWLFKIDPNIKNFMTPVIQGDTSLSTTRDDGNNSKEINMHFHGHGIQNAAIIIAAVIFSPKNSTIIIEEPELYQHSNSIEVLVDLFNYAVNELGKQIIIVTHSLDIINAYCSDIGEGKNRGTKHKIAKPEDFKLITIDNKSSLDKIHDYDLAGKKYTDVRDHFKTLLG